MRPHLRSAIVPFVATLVVLVWYVNRNVAAEALPPQVEPSTELVLGALAGAVVASAAIAAIVAVVLQATLTAQGTDPARDPYRRRVLRPDDTALAIFAVVVALLGLWSLVALAGIGPALPMEVLTFLVAPLGLPLLVLAPLAIHFHWALILGLVLSVLWISLLSALLSDVIHDRPLPIVDR